DVAAQVMVEVRGADPAFFFHVIVESIENLRRQRWPGLSLDLQVPCPGHLDEGNPCAQTFSLADLRRRRAGNRIVTECVTCGTVYDTTELLTGFSGVAEGLSSVDEPTILRHLEDLAASVDAMRADVQEVRGGLATATKGVFHVLLAVNTL